MYTNISLSLYNHGSYLRNASQLAIFVHHSIRNESNILAHSTSSQCERRDIMDLPFTFKSNQLDHSRIHLDSALVCVHAHRDSKLPRPSARSRRRTSARAPDTDRAMPPGQATLEEHEESIAKKPLSSCVIPEYTRTPTDLGAGGLATLRNYGFDFAWDDCQPCESRRIPWTRLAPYYLAIRYTSCRWSQ
jgi:hypothetical protein